MNKFDEIEKAFEETNKNSNVDPLAIEAKDLGLIEHHLCEDCNRDLNDCTCEEDEDYYDEDQDEFNDYDEEDDDDYEIDNSKNNFTMIGSNPFDEAEKLFEESKKKEIENKLNINLNKTEFDKNLLEEYNKIKSSQQLTQVKQDEFESIENKFKENQTTMSKNVETKNTTFIRNLFKLNFY